MRETASSALSLQMELGSSDLDLDLFSLGEEVIWKIFPKPGTPNTNTQAKNNNPSNRTNDSENDANHIVVDDTNTNTNSANERSDVDPLGDGLGAILASQLNRSAEQKLRLLGLI